ncbi:unnamed protein product [Caenorhabditis auriculariae]|uniref:GHMP kinase N-terminal domain-containing protein n=1 Tax=Caenorhabditis auriculariae TaxID=2777116 RepID=A0A8S1HTE0_9PELO|nr:unnamed protein product [Caenorhabditis auriculariae]
MSVTETSSEQTLTRDHDMEDGDGDVVRVEIPSQASDTELSLDSPSGSTSRAPSSVSHHASPMRNTTSGHGGLFVSAPGKIILFGEHAVVYGRTAIAGSIDLRTYVSLYTSADGRIYLSLPDLGVEKTWMLKDLLKAADRLAADYPVEEDQPPSLEVLVPIARKLSGSCEDQCGVQHLAILAFWYLLLGVAHRKSAMARMAKGLPPPALPSGLHRETTGVTEPGAIGDAIGDEDVTEAERAMALPVPPATPTPSSMMTSSPLLTASAANLAAASANAQQDLLAVKTTVRFRLPSCVGLGSSGAYCVCIATALLQTAGLIPPPSVVADDQGDLTWEDEHLDMIRKWATAAESLIHGRASGLDAAVCTYGGVASFKPGHRIEHLKNLPDLRVILVNSKVERNTARMVQTVKERLKKFPGVVDALFGSIDAISLEAAKILHRPPLGEENGDGGSSSALENGLGPFVAVGDSDHHSLQPTRGGSVRSSSLASYVAGGKRNSSASAISATSEKGELVDTFSKLNDLCRINNQLLIALGRRTPESRPDLYHPGPLWNPSQDDGRRRRRIRFCLLETWTSVRTFPDTPQTLLDMIEGELTKLGFEVWQPPLGGPGVMEHARRPELFATPAGSTACSTPAAKRQ